MRLLSIFAALCFLPASAWSAANTGFPFADESLTYSINWPSGLSLGEGHLTAKKSGPVWNLELNIDAGVPGVPVKDFYTSSSSMELCSGTLTKNATHGSKRTEETTTIDLVKNIATRATRNGGKSEFAITDCMKDALGYLFWSRRELGQGRVPKAQSVLFGAVYQASIQYAGASVVRIADKDTQTDKLVCLLKGPASDIRFEMFVARDAARTPVLFRVPMSMGTFSMELVR